MANVLPYDEDQSELLQIIKKFIVVEIRLMRAEMSATEDIPA